MTDLRVHFLAIVRHFIGIVGGYLVAQGGSITEPDLDTIAGAIVAIGAIGLSLWDKRKKQPETPENPDGNNATG